MRRGEESQRGALPLRLILAAGSLAVLALGSYYAASGAFAVGNLAAVLFVASLVWFASRSAELAATAGFPFLAVLAAVRLGFSGPGLALFLPALMLSAAGLLGALRRGAFSFDPELDIRWWRVIARPFALLFIPIDLFFGHTAVLLLLGALSLLFITLDMVRLLTAHRLSRLFKEKENKRFSSMTAFLAATFLIFLVFGGSVPYLALGFITVGDLFGKVIGIGFGRTRLLRERTLEGSLGFLSGSFMAGWVIYSLLPVPLYAALAGPPFAAAVELFSMDLDDNFTVGIVTGGFLFALRYFLKG